MNIEFVGRHVQVDERIRSHAQEKLAKVARFLKEPIEVHVTLDAEKSRQIAELRIAHRHGSLHSREENHDLLEAVGLAIDAVEEQARRTRKRAVDKRRRANRDVAARNDWPVEILARESVGHGGAPQIVESSSLEIKPMSLDEAALALDTSRHEFVVFRDASNERVNVLYRRKDGNFGLISPEL